MIKVVFLRKHCFWHFSLPSCLYLCWNLRPCKAPFLPLSFISNSQLYSKLYISLPSLALYHFNFCPCFSPTPLPSFLVISSSLLTRRAQVVVAKEWGSHTMMQKYVHAFWTQKTVHFMLHDMIYIAVIWYNMIWCNMIWCNVVMSARLLSTSLHMVHPFLSYCLLKLIVHLIMHSSSYL